MVRSAKHPQRDEAAATGERITEAAAFRATRPVSSTISEIRWRLATTATLPPSVAISASNAAVFSAVHFPR
jgi:hypothetical protein